MTSTRVVSTMVSVTVSGLTCEIGLSAKIGYREPEDGELVQLGEDTLFIRQ